MSRPLKRLGGGEALGGWWLELQLASRIFGFTVEVEPPAEIYGGWLALHIGVFRLVLFWMGESRPRFDRWQVEQKLGLIEEDGTIVHSAQARCDWSTRVEALADGSLWQAPDAKERYGDLLASRGQVEARAVQDHLVGCEDCRAHLDDVLTSDAAHRRRQ